MKHIDNLITAVKSLQKSELVDPLSKQEFDTYIVEQMQKQRTMVLQKKTSTRLEESTPKLHISSKEEGRGIGVKGQIKSSIRKAREDKDKFDG